jgi:hypothetical protein
VSLFLGWTKSPEGASENKERRPPRTDKGVKGDEDNGEEIEKAREVGSFINVAKCSIMPSCQHS